MLSPRGLFVVFKHIQVANSNSQASVLKLEQSVNFTVVIFEYHTVPEIYINIDAKS